MAIRGERLALMELRDDRLSVHEFAVVEIDADERIVAVTPFDRDSLPAAARHIGYRWLEVEEFEHRQVAELAIELTHAGSVGDGDWARERLSESCVFVDHRRLGWPVSDKASIIEMIEAQSNRRGASINPEVLAINGRGRMVSLVTWTTSDSNELVFAATPAISVMKVSDGQIVAIELFADDDLLAARRRFDELTHEPDGDRLVV